MEVPAIILDEKNDTLKILHVLSKGDVQTLRYIHHRLTVRNEIRVIEKIIKLFEDNS